jgi:Ala-tRNA(Pro) deacylase
MEEVMILQRLTAHLDQNNIKYIVIYHSPAFTAREIALSAHIPKKEFAKTVIAKVDGETMMIVLPATQMVDFVKLRLALGADAAMLATEREFNSLFPGCDIGAMPPFGNLFDIPVIVAESLREDEEIAFNGGTHKELVKMSYKDFERLVKPKVAQFAVDRKARVDLYEHGIT